MVFEIIVSIIAGYLIYGFRLVREDFRAKNNAVDPLDMLKVLPYTLNPSAMGIIMAILLRPVTENEGADRRVILGRWLFSLIRIGIWAMIVYLLIQYFK